MAETTDVKTLGTIFYGVGALMLTYSVLEAKAYAFAPHVLLWNKCAILCFGLIKILRAIGLVPNFQPYAI